MDDVSREVLPPRSLSRRMREMAEHQTEELAKEVQELIQETDPAVLQPPNGTNFLEFALLDRVREILKMGAVIAITDPPVRAALARGGNRQAGKRSGEARAQNSVKNKFLEWALMMNERNPSMSKNDVAQRYARENQGTSVATLRRYLSAIPNEKKKD